MEEALSPADSPQHGFRGDQLPRPVPPVPVAASVAVSREVGARGGEVARRLAARLGWPVYDREMLEFAAQDAASVDGMFAELPPEAGPWIEQRLDFLRRHHVLAADESFEGVARLILTIAAKGEAIFVGRGAGFILPRETTLHVRMTAPLADREAYFSQWQRLTREEAAEQVRVRTEKRDAFLAACFHLPSDGILYDMVLNSSALGVELCTDLITVALRCKRVDHELKSDDHAA
jgi:cytidylate kinase